MLQYFKGEITVCLGFETGYFYTFAKIRGGGVGGGVELKRLSWNF